MKISWTFTDIPDYITDPLTLAIALLAAVVLLYIFLRRK